MDTTVAPRPALPAAEPPPPAMAYLLDQDSEGVMRRSFSDLGIVDGHVGHGSIDTAIEDLVRRGSPNLLVVDVSGIEDPMSRINHLAQVCDPSIEVVVIGDRNDVVLYRDMKAAGVAEYFFKPLVSTVISRVLGGVMTGSADQRSPRTGKLVIVLGVRGGVGATLVSVQSAWYLAEERQRRVLLLDLDLQSGDVALQLDMTPSHALREALDHPERVDDLFLERGVAQVTSRLGLFAALEPLSDVVVPDEGAVLQLVTKLLQKYRFVIVDIPVETALRLQKLLHMPSTLLLVSDGSLIAAREVNRWRERIGPNTPDRSTLHILNRKGVEGGLPDKHFLRALIAPPDIIIPYDREVARSSLLGAKGVQKCAAVRRGMAAVFRELAGARDDAPRPWWKRIFG